MHEGDPDGCRTAGNTMAREVATGLRRWALVPALPPCCVTLGKSLLLSGPQFPHAHHEGVDCMVGGLPASSAILTLRSPGSSSCHPLVTLSGPCLGLQGPPAPPPPARAPTDPDFPSSPAFPLQGHRRKQQCGQKARMF